MEMNSNPRMPASITLIDESWSYQQQTHLANDRSGSVVVTVQTLSIVLRRTAAVAVVSRQGGDPSLLACRLDSIPSC
jgi:hypothetical protein